MSTTINDIPGDELKAMRSKVIDQIEQMDEDELKIALQSKASLSKVIAGLFKEIAYALGYIIALPLAYGAKIAESLWKGFGKGFDDAMSQILD